MSRLLAERLDPYLPERGDLGRQLPLAFRVAALLQEKCDDAGVLLRFEAAGFNLRHRVRNQFEQLIEGSSGPLDGERTPRMLGDGVTGHAGLRELRLPSRSLG